MDPQLRLPELVRSVQVAPGRWRCRWSRRKRQPPAVPSELEGNGLPVTATSAGASRPDGARVGGGGDGPPFTTAASLVPSELEVMDHQLRLPALGALRPGGARVGGSVRWSRYKATTAASLGPSGAGIDCQLLLPALVRSVQVAPEPVEV